MIKLAKKHRRFRLIADAVVFGLVIALILVWQWSPKTNQAENLGKVKETRVSFLAVGDIMLSRGVARSIMGSDNPHKPFEKMADVFRSTDFNFGNLESPISGRNDVFGKGLIFNTNERDLAGLTAYNFKILNIANNHALDQGTHGLRQTQKFLSARSLDFVGAGDNLEEAWQPKIVVAKGVKIGFVGASYASYNDGGVETNEYVARIEDTENLKKAINQLRSQKADLIVATMHAGDEYTRYPNKSQKDFAYTAIDLGADIVIGAHPHWTQIFEQYKGKYIFYSLGNFIFDQPWQETREGLTLKITVRNRRLPAPGAFRETRIEQIELIPVVIENFSTPRLAGDAEAAQILKKIGTDEKIIRP